MREVRILTTSVLPVGVEEAGSVVAAWAAEGAGRVVCAANVHMVMEAWDDPAFARLLDAADLVVCDGRPLIWACRLQGAGDAQHARGLDLMREVSARAARRGLRVGLYGGESRVTEVVRDRLAATHSGLEVVYAYSPPFRDLTAAEDDAVMAALEEARVDVLFVSLGCPKQERWMMAHRDRTTCVALGVGAAFDMVAGTLRVAPRWMQASGLEWVHRLVSEPRRLWRRYARHNARFVLLVAQQLLRERVGNDARRRPRG
jgi:N-acetylglucosaminyldiphosphoundecaprenol N-acetyl-beta-D-mannosaminyltransferase